MRLIDADALMKEFTEFVKDSNNSDFADVPTWNDAVSLVESMPSAQPETMYYPQVDGVTPSVIVQPDRENVHGNWVGIDDEPCETFECDRCGFVLDDWILGAFYNFCPNCGADMRANHAD